MAEGTVTRLAALKVLEELRPSETVTICLPLFLAGGEGPRLCPILPDDCHRWLRQALRRARHRDVQRQTGSKHRRRRHGAPHGILAIGQRAAIERRRLADSRRRGRSGGPPGGRLARSPMGPPERPGG